MNSKWFHNLSGYLKNNYTNSWLGFRNIYKKGFVKNIPGDDIQYVGHTLRYLVIITDIFLLISLFRPLDYFLGNVLMQCTTLPVEIVEKSTLGTELTADDRQAIYSVIQCRFLSQIIELFLMTLIYSFCWVKYSFTPAMWLFGVRIVRKRDLKKMTIYDALKRIFGIFVAVLPLGIGLFWMMFDKRAQGVHDKIADTIFVRKAFLDSKK